MLRKRQIIADISLVAVAAIWGANFVIIKMTLSEMPPLAYLAIRFLLAFIVLAAARPQSFCRINSAHLREGVLVGLLLFAGFSIQTLGLILTTPGISGFLTITYVAMVPLLAAAKERKMIPPRILASGFSNLAGAALLTLGGRFSFGSGESLTILSALFFSLYIMLLDRATRRMPAISLTGIQLAVVGVLSAAASCIWETGPTHISSFGWYAIVYGALLGSIAAFAVQTVAQKYTPPSHTAIILSTEATFALLFSLFAELDSFNEKTLLGCGLIIAGILAIELPAGIFGKTRVTATNDPAAGPQPDPVAAKSDLENVRDHNQ